MASADHEKLQLRSVLSYDGISGMISVVDRFLKKQQKYEELVSKKIAERGELFLKQQISQFTKGTGELLNSVTTEVTTNKVIFRVTSDHAVYREFGVGIVARGSTPADSPFPEMVYSDKQSWTYRGEDGRFYTSHGYKAGNYMYNTFKYLENEIPKIITETMKEVGLK